MVGCIRYLSKPNDLDGEGPILAENGRGFSRCVRRVEFEKFCFTFLMSTPNRLRK